MGNIDGLKQAIEALQSLDEAQRNKILKDISAKNPAMADQLRAGLFEFSDLQYLTSHDFKIIWWEVAKSVWYLALRKANPGVMKMVKSNITSRAFEELKNEIGALGPRPLSQVIQAQREICDQIRLLAGQGKMTLPSRKKNDPLV